MAPPIQMHVGVEVADFSDLWVQGTMFGWGQDRTNPFAAVRGDKLVMWPTDKLLWTLVSFLLHLIFQCHSFLSFITNLPKIPAYSQHRLCLPRTADATASSISSQCPVTLADLWADEPSKDRWDNIITASAARNMNCAHSLHIQVVTLGSITSLNTRDVTDSESDVIRHFFWNPSDT